MMPTAFLVDAFSEVTFYAGAMGLLLWYALCRSLECGPRAITAGDLDKLRRIRSWYLTLPISIVFGYVLGPSYMMQLVVALLDGPPAVVAFLTTENAVARGAAMCICAFFVLDLVVGVIEYRDKLQMSTGWVHHSLYYVLYTYLYSIGGTQYLIAGACCEIPTSIMALGTIFPALRNDIAFGLTFFVTRICWFVLLLAVYCTPAYNTFLPLYIATPPLIAAIGMHLWWMRLWFVGMSLRARIAAKAKAVV